MSHCSRNTKHTDEYNSKDECGQNDRSAVASSIISLCSHSGEMQLGNRVIKCFPWHVSDLDFLDY